VSPYREPPPDPIGLAEPTRDAAWYEHLAWQVLLAHQPAEARRKRPTAPPVSTIAVLELVAKHARPYCRRCRRDVEKVSIIPDADSPGFKARVECHGEVGTLFIHGKTIAIALAGGTPQSLLDVMRQPVFEPEPVEYARFEDERDGVGEGFEPARVRSHAIPTLTAAVMVRKADKP